MFDTASVFDVMAADDADRRVASRRALALAHTRVENQLGAFLRGAVTSEDFDTRLAAVREDFDAHIASACEETGHDQPQHISASLIDHFRVERRWQPRGAAVVAPFDHTAKEHMPGVGAKNNRMYEHIKEQCLADGGSEDHCKEMAARTVNKYRSEHGETKDSKISGFGDEGYGQAPASVYNTAPAVNTYPDTQEQQNAYLQGRGLQPQQEQMVDEWGNPIVDEWGNPIEYQPQQYGDPEAAFDDWGGYQRPVAAANPSDQADDSNNVVTCPECGGSKKTANGQPCPKCGGKGVVRNFGDSVLDHVAVVKRAETGEAGLGEAEPKMDKRKWTPQTVGNPDPGSRQHPTKVKDPLAPIIMTNRDQDGHDLSEIGEQTTTTMDLKDTTSDDGSGFSTATPGGMAPGTKVFPKGDQASPVTRDSGN